MTDSEYFKWAAHDDLLGPGLLEACVDVLDRDAAVVLASPASALIDEAGLPFFRRCHAQQFSAAAAGAYRAKWFSGRRRASLFVQQIKLLLGFCQPCTQRRRWRSSAETAFTQSSTGPFHAAITAGD